MKISKFIILSLFLLPSLSIAQDFKVYRNHELGMSINKLNNNFSYYLGEMVHAQNGIPFKILTGIKLNLDYIRRGEMPERGKKNTNSNFKLLNPIFSGSVAVPLGVEFNIKNLGIGVSHDLVTYNLGKAKDSTFFYNKKYSNFRPQKFSHIFASKQSRNVNSNIYINYTFNETLTLKLGLTTLKSVYILDEKGTNKNLRIGRNLYSPFVSLRINIEK